MPILSVGARSIEHICLLCAAERTIADRDLVRLDRALDPDGSHFQTPPCEGCGAFEDFEWHDAVYVNERGVVDALVFSARQMAAIETVVRRLGGARGRIVDAPPRARYARAPEHPDADLVRALVLENLDRGRPAPRVDF